MSIRFMRLWVWIGSVLAGGTLVLMMNRIFPHTSWIIVFGVAYLVSGWVLDQTVQTYDSHDRQCFTRKYGRLMPLLLGLGGPFYLTWEFFRGLFRYY